MMMSYDSLSNILIANQDKTVCIDRDRCILMFRVVRRLLVLATQRGFCVGVVL